MEKVVTRSRKELMALALSSLMLPVAAQAWDFSDLLDGVGLGVAGSGKLQTQLRDVGRFDEIELHGSTDIEVRVGDSTAVSVSGDDNIVPLIVTEVRNGKLVIRSTHSYHTRHSPKVIISTPALTALSIDGSGDAKLSHLNGEKLSLAISGSGDILAEGAVNELQMDIDGSGDANLVDLQTKRANVEVNGSGDVNLTVSSALDAEVNGSGDINYHGDPAQVSHHVHGSGDITKR